MFIHLAEIGPFPIASGAKDSRLILAPLAAIRVEICNEKMLPSLLPVGIKSCPAAEGGAKLQTIIAAKIQPGNHEFPASRLIQDLPAP